MPTVEVLRALSELVFGHPGALEQFATAFGDLLGA